MCASTRTDSDRKSSQKSVFFLLEMFRFFISPLKIVGEMFCRRNNYYRKDSSDYSLNSVISLALQTLHKLRVFQNTSAKYLCQVNRYHLLVVIGTMSRLLLMMEPQHHILLYEMEVVEVYRECLLLGLQYVAFGGL